MKDVNFWKIILLTKQSEFLQLRDTTLKAYRKVIVGTVNESIVLFQFLGAPAGFSSLSFLFLNPKTLCGPVVYLFSFLLSFFSTFLFLMLMVKGL